MKRLDLHGNVVTRFAPRDVARRRVLRRGAPARASVRRATDGVTEATARHRSDWSESGERVAAHGRGREPRVSWRRPLPSHHPNAPRPRASRRARTEGWAEPRRRADNCRRVNGKCSRTWRGAPLHRKLRAPEATGAAMLIRTYLMLARNRMLGGARQFQRTL